MANLLQLINKTKIIDERAEDIVQSILNDYNHGHIATKTDMFYSIVVKLKQFYNAANKPLMHVRKALGLPNPTEFDMTINEAIDDITAMFNESSNIMSVVDEAYKMIEVDRARVNNSARLLESLYEKAEILINDIELNDIFMETFANLDNFNPEGAKESPVNVNTIFGYASLSLSQNTVLNSQIEKTEILDGSTGFPGNTHQADIVSDEVRFIGEDGIHASLPDIIDNNDDTWMEYELYSISYDTYIMTLGMGFNYYEGIRWITDDNSLKLSIKITFNDLQEMNVLSLSPFIPEDKDAIAAYITGITISDGKGSVIRPVESVSESFNTEKVYLFPKQNVKTIVINFEQSYAYSTNIGHLYYQEITTDSINYFTQNELKINKRADYDLPSSASVGLIYNDELQRYIQPSTTDVQQDSNMAVSNLFTVPEVDGAIKGAFELLPANRYMIGIQDILCESNLYNELSDYVSVEYEADSPIQSVILQVDEDIPDVFESSSITKDWIRYYISIDAGENWYPIKPQGIFKYEGYDKYLINSGVPYEMRSDDIGYIETSSPEHRICIKAELERPTDIPNSESYSPIIYSYMLQII